MNTKYKSIDEIAEYLKENKSTDIDSSELWSIKDQLNYQFQDHIPREAGTLNVLFNKGRYFEMSAYPKQLLKKVALLTGIKVSYGSMLVGPRHKLPILVKAFNLQGYKLNITLDWI